MKRSSSACLTRVRQSAGYAGRNVSVTLTCTSIAASVQNRAAAACEHAKRLDALCRIDTLKPRRLARNANPSVAHRQRELQAEISRLVALDELLQEPG